MPSEWISVEDRLPVIPEGWIDIMVIACCNGIVEPMYYYRDTIYGKTVERWRYCWFEFPDEAVTYWMPFPDPPKEDEKFVIKVDMFGELKLTSIGLFYGEPILFICKTKCGKKFMGFVTEPSQQYLLIPVTSERRDEILDNRISIRDAIIKSGMYEIWICNSKPDSNIFTCELCEINQLDDDLLPDEKLYFRNDRLNWSLKDKE